MGRNRHEKSPLEYRFSTDSHTAWNVQSLLDGKQNNPMTLPFISQAITTDRVGAVLGVPFMLCADNHIGMNLGSWPSAEPTEGSQIYTSRKTIHSSLLYFLSDTEH